MSPVLTSATPFQRGEKVQIHPAAEYRVDRPPLGSPVLTETVGRNGELDLEAKGLRHGESYVAYRERNGVHQYVRFRVPKAGEKP